MIRTYKTEGIVLKRINFSEADKILTVFSKHYGKLSCIAKGVRKLTSRKSSSLELFNQSALFLHKGKNLEVITETTLLNSFSGFRKNLKKVAVAYHLTELVDKMLKEEQDNIHVYSLLKNSLKQLEAKDVNLNDLRIDFKTKLLKFTGFGLPDSLKEQFLDKHIEKIIEKRLKFFYV
jgi:DNA repair protein RecO (recombination protein O)